jgi:hypothetical protein
LEIGSARERVSGPEVKQKKNGEERQKSKLQSLVSCGSKKLRKMECPVGKGKRRTRAAGRVGMEE